MSWNTTWSCWQQNRHSSVAGRKRQCGVCAACFLRRLSVHAAGLEEVPETYVWENLSARSFEAGAASAFSRITTAHREYAIAGALHYYMQVKADLRQPLAFAAVLAVLLGHRLVVYWQQRRPAAVSAVKPEP